MAGTMQYRLKVDHVYQRRFEQAELKEVLRGSFWYMVTRRPAIRIVEESASAEDRILTVDVACSRDLASPRSIQTLAMDFGFCDFLRNFITYLHGAYFSIEAGQELIHGDAWSLASLLSGAELDLSAQEVLYIGKAFGTDGSRSALDRLESHSTLQKIYEDHTDLDCDIFVVPLSLEKRSWTNEDHLPVDEDGPSLTKYYEYFAELETGAIKQSAVDLIEHSLISNFRPPYNAKLLDWLPASPTASMRRMSDAGFRLIQVHLNGRWSLARFYSEASPEKFRSRLLSNELVNSSIHSADDHEVHKSVTKVTIVTGPEGQEMLEDAADRTGVLLRAFGTLAPVLRKPPGVTLPPDIPAYGAHRESHDQLRRQILGQREQRAAEEAPIRHDGMSTYDPASGSILVGIYPDGTEQRQTLYKPSTKEITSTVIFGESGTGRTNHLRLLLTEAMLSGLIFPAVLEVEGKGEFQELRSRASVESSSASGVDECVDVLNKFCSIIKLRMNRDHYKPGPYGDSIFLIGIDDADQLLLDSTSAALIRYILTNGKSFGVGLALVFGQQSAIAGDLELHLAQPLADADCFAVYGDTGRASLEFFRASYSASREKVETWSSDELPLFMVFQTAKNCFLGFAACWLDSRHGDDIAKAWARQSIRELGASSLGEWHLVEGENHTWWALDIAARWLLRQHKDVWLLTIVESSRPACSGSALIAWAEMQIHSRYHVELGSWQRGPGAADSEAPTLYIEGSGEIRPKDRSGYLKRLAIDLL